MKTNVTHLKLPFAFKIDALVQDLHSALELDWVAHFNKDGYSGDWNSIALYSETGDPSNIIAHNTGLIRTELLNKCTYFDEVIDHFKCRILSARLMRLAPGAYIKPHRDYQLGYEDGTFRVHVPITTNDKVEFRLNGETIQMLPGECWYTNVNFEHSVSNTGEQERVHLVIDGERNEWSDKLFFSLAPEEDFFNKEEEHYDPDTTEKIIESLKLLNDPAAKKLIATYREKLAGKQ